MAEEIKPRGLSYSSFTEFSACQRKWYLRKVAKYPIDSDAEDSTIAFDLGKSFHFALETTKHDLTGFTFNQCVEVCKTFNVNDVEDAAMIFAMLGAYKRVHEKTKLKVVGCEVEIAAPGFFGIIDAVLQDSDGFIWIVDVKTCATFQRSTIDSLPDHVQLNIYSRHFDLIAHACGLKDAPFAGVRLRSTTKSKLQKKESESLPEYISRMSKGIKSYDIIVPAKLLTNVNTIYAQHQRANEITSSAKIEDESKFPPNYSNCFSFFRPCNFWSRCWGHNYSEVPAIEVIES